MSQTTPGWYPDPAGTFDQRYHDGNGWTEHVVDAAGTQSTDPVPPAPPAPPTAPPTAAPPPGYGAPPTQTGFGVPSAPPPGDAGGPGFGAPPPQQAYGQPPPGFGGPPQQPYGQPQPGYGQAPFGTAPATGGIKPTIGVVAAGVGMLFVLLGLFAFDWARVPDFDDFGIGVSDLGEGDAPFFPNLWGSFLYLLAFLVAIVLTVLALRLPQVESKVTAQYRLIAGGVLIFFAVWNLLTIFQIGTFSDEGVDLATAFGAWLTLLGWGGLAAQFVPQVADRPLTK